MIQEQITTSSPKCLDGNAGFGVVAQTSGMAPNVARDVGMLSGYSHLFPAGDANNPTAFLHVIRRSGGTDRHIISRVSDCGNDYSGRTNRIGHHWIVEESDISSLPCGPAAIVSQPDLFCTKWNEKSQELPRGKKLPNPPVAADVCRTWQQRLGDAGWGGVVAERIEKGDPISIIFEPGTDPLPLVAEALALLPTALRWKTTFSTFFMKSQEPPGTAKVQVKCIVVGSDEMAFAKLTPNTLLIDLRQKPTEVPSGQYVEVARKGRPVQSEIPQPTQIDRSDKTESAPAVEISQLPDYEEDETYDFASMPVPQSRSASIPDRQAGTTPKKKRTKRGFPWLIVVVLGFLALSIPVVGFLIFSDVKMSELTTTDSADRDQQVVEQAEKERKEAEAAEQAEQERKETEAQAAAEQTEKERQEREKAEAQAATEKANKERKEKEAKEKADAEKAEKEREKNEAKEKADAEKKQIEDLLPVWEGIALPLTNVLNQTGLPKSEFLWKIKDRVKLDIVPFVDWNTSLKNIDKPIKITKKDHVIDFSRIDTDITGNPRETTLLRFELNQSGLSYQWNVPSNYNDLNFHRELNRFLLSKLHVKVDDKVVKEIFLWTPVKYNDPREFRHNRTTDGAFALWRPQQGKEFIIFPEDQSPMLLDFKEILRGKETSPIAKPLEYIESSSLCFAPKIQPIDGSAVVSTVEPTGSDDLKVRVMFISNSLKDTLQELKRIKKQIKDCATKLSKYRDYRKHENIQKNYPQDLARLQNLPDVNKRNEALTQLHDDKNNADIILAERQRLLEENDALKTNQTNMDKKIKDEEAKWSNIGLENFSIYLLKPGMTAGDAAKPENRLLLLQVGSPE